MKYSFLIVSTLILNTFAAPSFAQVVTPSPQKDTLNKNQSPNICATVGVTGGVLAAAGCFSNEYPTTAPLSSRSIGIDLLNPRVKDDVIL